MASAAAASCCDADMLPQLGPAAAAAKLYPMLFTLGSRALNRGTSREVPSSLFVIERQLPLLLLLDLL